MTASLFLFLFRFFRFNCLVNEYTILDQGFDVGKGNKNVFKSSYRTMTDNVEIRFPLHEEHYGPLKMWENFSL